VSCPFDLRLARTPYLVLPKLAIQVMPMEWRIRFDAMLAEMEDLGIATPSYHVFRDDGPGERYTRATVVNETTGFVRIVRGEHDPWADYRHDQLRKVAALCPNFTSPAASTASSPRAAVEDARAKGDGS
jgi:hypothetical protein